MKNIDFGFDLNNDGHCDKCGCFVDNYGHHRARMVFQYLKEQIYPGWIEEDHRIETLSFESFVSEFFEGNPYNMYTNQTFKLWPLILRYSLNDPDDPLSCRGLNDFLRYEKIHPNSDVIELMDVALCMNLVISKFKLKKNLITFRGMAFNKNDNFVKMLDNAYIHLQENKYFLFVDNGFVSTTKDIDYAKSFISKSNKDVCVLCSYISLAGAYCMPLSKEWGTTKNDFEQEVLFKSMQEYYICAIQKYKIGTKQYYNCIIINTKEKLHD